MRRVVVGIVVSLVYLAGAFFFVLEAWGRRGEPKPEWFGVAALLANFGWLVPLWIFLDPVRIVKSVRRRN